MLRQTIRLRLATGSPANSWLGRWKHWHASTPTQEWKCQQHNDDDDDDEEEEEEVDDDDDDDDADADDDNNNADDKNNADDDNNTSEHLMIIIVIETDILKVCRRLGNHFPNPNF
jgi:hypothetical protein